MASRDKPNIPVQEQMEKARVLSEAFRLQMLEASIDIEHYLIMLAAIEAIRDHVRSNCTNWNEQFDATVLNLVRMLVASPGVRPLAEKVPPAHALR